MINSSINHPHFSNNHNLNSHEDKLNDPEQQLATIKDVIYNIFVEQKQYPNQIKDFIRYSIDKYLPQAEILLALQQKNININEFDQFIYFLIHYYFGNFSNNIQLQLDQYSVSQNNLNVVNDDDNVSPFKHSPFTYLKKF